jgi:acyl-coenzyme A synthetase/AMP-(fatty) acid ligase
MTEFPRTPSGKIQKFRLRDQVASTAHDDQRSAVI